ncbi:RAP domain protein [Babesia caballi]|uniref:RAP domain protein n=1 Tax=Babesia caballi TaxID=5871 RepID=A0AAV4M1H8_BABCB|nr:RAP domain protein [Babesia caballi]
MRPALARLNSGLLRGARSHGPSAPAVLQTAPVSRRKHQASISTVSRYLETMYDHDVAAFLRLLRTGVFDRSEDLRSMFSGFQRYLAHLRAEEFVELLELLRSHDLRDNDEGADLALLLLCEMNQRMLSGQPRLFSLKQTHRVCAVLRHFKFNRPAYLVAPDERATAAAVPSATGGSAPRFEEGFTVVAAADVGGSAGQTSTQADADTHPTEPQSAPATSGMPQSGTPSKSSHSLGGLPSRHNRPRLFHKDFPEVAVPICEANVGSRGPTRACSSCCSRYGQLLHLPGHEQLALLIVLLGRSIVKQAAKVRRRHENAVISYIMLSSHLNCTLNAHILRRILAQHQGAILQSRSLRNIGIVLHASRKCKTRCSALTARLLARLADVGQFEALCAGERNRGALLVAFGQVIGGLIVANALPVSPDVRRVGANIVTYLVDHYEALFGPDAQLDAEVVKGMCGNARLLVDYLASKGVDFARVLLDGDLDRLYELIARGHVDYPKDFKTSDLHRQVASVLALLGLETDEEVRVGAHVCDLALRRGGAVMEIDGPYHFNTSLNHRWDTHDVVYTTQDERGAPARSRRVPPHVHAQLEG